MRITLVVPGLLALPGDVLSRVPELRRLAALASVSAETDLDAALFCDLAIDAHPAPMAALGAGLDVGDAWVIRADPVTMVVGREDVRLAGYVHDLDDAERASLLALLSLHFAPDAVRFEAPRADAWFAMSRTAQSIATTPLEIAAGRTLRCLLPAGRDAARWRRWFTEIQMLLHEHGLGERTGAPVNAVWFAGGGQLPDAAGLPSIDAQAAPGRHGDLARGLARLSGSDATALAPLDHALGKRDCEVALVALAPIHSAGMLADAARDFIAPSLAALDRGAVSAFRLIADGRGCAASWRAERPSWWRRIAHRQAEFAFPAAWNP